MLAGLAHPVLDSQKIFRAVLDAMAHPGRVVAVPAPIETPAPLWPATTSLCLALVDTETPLWPATTSLCLALVDTETPLWLDRPARRPDVVNYLRFHCGCPIATEPGAARFAVVVDPSQMPDLEAFDAGSDEYPDRSATIIVQVEALEARTGQRLTGPGIEIETRITLTGLPDGLWPEMRRNHERFPRGVDLIFAASDAIVAIPRTTRTID